MERPRADVNLTGAAAADDDDDVQRSVSASRSSSIQVVKGDIARVKVR